MGNRGFISFDETNLGIYLHWNGGRDSVEAFLAYCKFRGFRSDEYGVARCCQVIANYFGGELSIGVYSTKGRRVHEFSEDNGVYCVKDWEIVTRIDAPLHEQHVYDLVEMILDINRRQPIADQVGEDKILEYFNANKKEEKPIKKWNVSYTMHGNIQIEAMNEEEAESKFESMDENVLKDSIELIEFTEAWEEEESK